MRYELIEVTDTSERHPPHGDGCACKVNSETPEHWGLAKAAPFQVYRAIASASDPERDPNLAHFGDHVVGHRTLDGEKCELPKVHEARVVNTQPEILPWMTAQASA